MNATSNDSNSIKIIPKTIHYCWFGGKPLTEMGERCLKSWNKYCPDYKVIRWDEDSFDLSLYPYAQEAYDAKKYAFVSDVVRLYALVNYGGIYMDTDVELIKSPDTLLKYEALSGFESETQIPTGLMASCANQPLMTELLAEYEDLHFLRPDGSYDLTTNVTRITNTCLKYGFVPNNTKQCIRGFTLLPSDYLCPKDGRTREVNITSNTIAIHHFDGSWLSPEDGYAASVRERLPSFVPAGAKAALARLIAVGRYQGVARIPAYAFQRLKGLEEASCQK